LPLVCACAPSLPGVVATWTTDALLGVHSSAALVAAAALVLAAVFRSADRRAISCCLDCCFSSSSSSSLDSSEDDDDDEEEEDDEAEETDDTSTSLTSEPSSGGVTEAEGDFAFSFVGRLFLELPFTVSTSFLAILSSSSVFVAFLDFSVVVVAVFLVFSFDVMLLDVDDFFALLWLLISLTSSTTSSSSLLLLDDDVLVDVSSAETVFLGVAADAMSLALSELLLLLLDEELELEEEELEELLLELDDDDELLDDDDDEVEASSSLSSFLVTFWTLFTIFGFFLVSSSSATGDLVSNLRFAAFVETGDLLDSGSWCGWSPGDVLVLEDFFLLVAVGGHKSFNSCSTAASDLTMPCSRKLLILGAIVFCLLFCFVFSKENCGGGRRVGSYDPFVERLLAKV
jgi:hypothetical protein